MSTEDKPRPSLPIKATDQVCELELLVGGVVNVKEFLLESSVGLGL